MMSHETQIDSGACPVVLYGDSRSYDTGVLDAAVVGAVCGGSHVAPSFIGNGPSSPFHSIDRYRHLPGGVVIREDISR